MDVIGTPSGPAPPAATLLDALANLGDSPWLTFKEGQSLDGGAVRTLAARWATALRDAGVASGDRVVVVMPNGPHFIGAFFGALLAGATPVPLAWPLTLSDPSRTLAALELQLAAAAPAAIVIPADHAGAGHRDVPMVTEPARTPSAHEPELRPDDPAFIQFTSGTTGAPRGAVISQRAAVASAWAMAEALAIGDRDVGVSWLPLFHDMGLVGVVLCSLLRRFPVHLMTPAEFLLRPERWLQRVAAAGATLTVGPNFAYELAARRSRATPDASSLRCALSGSEPVQRATVERFERRFGLPGRTLPVYGLAENTLGVCFSDPHRPAPDLRWGERAIPSVGRPLPGMTVAVDAAPGAEGEILVRGPALMSGYFRNPEATAAALRDGWLRTGDLGVIRDGRLHVSGREKELVIKAGRKFHSRDIEHVVAQATGETAGNVAALSVPNDASGSEDLVLLVELHRERAADLERRIQARLLEELDVRADRIRFVEAGTLPRTTSGKLRRHACAVLLGDA